MRAYVDSLPTCDTVHPVVHRERERVGESGRGRGDLTVSFRGFRQGVVCSDESHLAMPVYQTSVRSFLSQSSSCGDW